MRTRREVLAGFGTAAAGMSITAFAGASPVDRKNRRTSFTPGQIWLDTAGRAIQTHGGSIITIGDTYYWYGENKERTLPGSGIWHWGVRAYSSKDLYNWEDVGLIIPPNPNDPMSPLHPANMMDRPHIIFNAATNKFVCWLKVMEKDKRQTRTVLTADRFTGPYVIAHTGVQPLGMNAGDFDLVVYPDDAKAYTYFERVHSEMICADLSADYTEVSGHYSAHLPLGAPPQVREAPAYFQRKGKHYLVTSGTTHYHPNPSQVAVASTFHGPWETIGDIHPKDRSRTSFNSQISAVFKHPAKKDLYIALADRWISNLPEIEGPAYATGEAYAKFEEYFAKRFSTTGESATPEEREYVSGLLRQVNTSRATYVWLPFRFDNDRPFLDWRAEWSLDEFE